MDNSEIAFDGVVIVGGGYAGLHAATAARSAGVATMIIDPSPDHDFITRLASVTGGGAPRSDASVSFHALGHDVHQGRAVHVDDGVVELADGTRVGGGAVVIATGSVPAPAPIRGLEHASTLRTAAEALALRAKIDEARSVIIIGGGATGVQLAGTTSATHPDVSVTLVDREEHLLASMPRALGSHAAWVLRSRGVSMRLGEDVRARRRRRGAVLASGERLEGLVVWAGGFASAGTSLGDHVPVIDGRIEIDPQLRVLGWQRTFSAGDVAGHHATRWVIASHVRSDRRASRYGRRRERGPGGPRRDDEGGRSCVSRGGCSTSAEAAASQSYPAWSSQHRSSIALHHCCTRRSMPRT